MFTRISMKGRLASVLVAPIVLIACGGGEEEAPAAEAEAPAPAAQEAEQPAAAAEPAGSAQPTQEPAEQVPAQQAPATRPVNQVSSIEEVPYTPEMSGVVDPGMTREQVIGVWGEPAQERQTGDRVYLYYRNGCENSCGTYDLVLLEGGEVVDAVVRHPAHVYSGVSSSPAGRQPQFTPPDSTSNGSNQSEGSETQA